MKRALAVGGAIAMGGAVLGGAAAWTGRSLTAVEAAPAAAAPGDVDTVVAESGAGAPVDAGATPMKQRVAVLGLLNKRNGVSRDVTMRPGQALRVGDVVIRLRACEQTAPWEPEQLTGAFVQLDVQGVDRGWRRAFSGWLYKERPAYNVVLHPVYDVWTKSCAVTFPGTVPAAAASPRASSARKSPAARAPAEANDTDAPEATGTTPDSASASNAI